MGCFRRGCCGDGGGGCFGGGRSLAALMRFSALRLVRRKEMNSICLSIRLRSTRRNGIRYRRPILLMRSSFASIRRGDASLPDPVCWGRRTGDWGFGYGADCA